MGKNNNTTKVYENSVFSYCTKVYKMYHLLFSWYPSNIILHLKPGSYQFQNVIPKNSKYFLWYFNTFIIAMGIGFISCFYVIWHASSVSSAKLTVSIGLLGMGVLYIASAYKIIRNVNEIAQGFHCIEQVIKGMEQLCPSNNCENIQNKLFWETISRLMQFLTIIFAFIPFLLVPAAIYSTVDPFVLTVPLFFPINVLSMPTVKWFIISIRLYLATVCAMEACRFYGIFFPAILQLLEYQLRCIHMSFIHTFPFVQTPLYGLTFFKWYNMCRVANRISVDTWCSLLAILQGVGFFIFVTCNIASFKLYGIMPLQIYWLMPLVSFACAIIHYYFLPLIIHVRIDSEQNLSVRKHQLYLYCYQPSSGNNIGGFALKGFFDRKFYFKKLISFRPMGFSCGPFFEISNIKSQYFYDIFLRSVDGILLNL